ncbi:hypothetical protein M422DRAFT_35196 [Sphaerobolus stellatus SS14]|uniref:F-box domain-containing protein n=1 Tax=Sphaerobolus stellatus (strain SS14) TaxID=990650 RepID=A0A0C9VA86_SPHS4|nr:hypothetical protein M422DRAFT_35196 [Sphaerobolus stellatus SS14]
MTTVLRSPSAMEDGGSYALSKISLSSSPISILPEEILAQIFEYCASEDPHATPVLLSHVSFLWRRIATSTPRIWDTIYVALPSKYRDYVRTRTRLERSGAIPLNITLLVNEIEAGDKDLLDKLRDHLWHCSRLKLKSDSHEIGRSAVVFLGATSNDQLQLLERLDIKLSCLRELLDMDEDANDKLRNDVTDIFRVLAQVDAPRLRELNLQAASLPHPSLQVAKLSHESLLALAPVHNPSSLSLTLPFLHTLRIYEDHPMLADDITAASILHLLVKCPSLRTFVFRGSQSIFDSHGVADIPPIYLPHLHTLQLCHTFHQRLILSHIVAPSLKTFRLMWLNRPEILIDEFYEPDPSELSEAPTEHSQSPYTDLLSGAGLRALIRQSMKASGSPLPITVFDMDFADIRSPKDFLWAFEHMPFLVDFKIIGSDMSNKVLLALAKERISADGKREGWLCPRLKNLEFSRCDVITGIGVVALAKGRNPPLVEGEDTEGRPARLKRFILEGCQRVDCESVAVMQYIIGDVCFEVEKISDLYPENSLEMPD